MQIKREDRKDRRRKLKESNILYTQRPSEVFEELCLVQCGCLYTQLCCLILTLKPFSLSSAPTPPFPPPPSLYRAPTPREEGLDNPLPPRAASTLPSPPGRAAFYVQWCVRCMHCVPSPGGFSCTPLSHTLTHTIRRANLCVPQREREREAGFFACRLAKVQAQPVGLVIYCKSTTTTRCIYIPWGRGLVHPHPPDTMQH